MVMCVKGATYRIWSQKGHQSVLVETKAETELFTQTSRLRSE